MFAAGCTGFAERHLNQSGANPIAASIYECKTATLDLNPNRGLSVGTRGCCPVPIAIIETPSQPRGITTSSSQRESTSPDRSKHNCRMRDRSKFPAFFQDRGCIVLQLRANGQLAVGPITDADEFQTHFGHSDHCDFELW